MNQKTKLKTLESLYFQVRIPRVPLIQKYKVFSREKLSRRVHYLLI